MCLLRLGEIVTRSARQLFGARCHAKSALAVTPILPLFTRVFLFATRALLMAETRKYIARYLDSGIEPEGVMVFEGLFNIGKVTLNFTRLGDDAATCNFHVAPIRDGIVADTPISEAEAVLVAARVSTFFDTLKGYYPEDLVLDRCIFHDAGPKVTDELGRLVGIDYDISGHRLPGQGVANPVLHEIAIGIAGTSATNKFLPPQVAISITEKTQFRRQWGRFYLPFPDTNAIQTGGTISTGEGTIAESHVDTIRDAAGVLLDGLETDHQPMVVWSTKHQHAISVDQIQVDNLFDVIRRRRWKKSTYKQTHTLGA